MTPIPPISRPWLAVWIASHAWFGLGVFQLPSQSVAPGWVAALVGAVTLIPTLVLGWIHLRRKPLPLPVLFVPATGVVLSGVWASADMVAQVAALILQAPHLADAPHVDFAAAWPGLLGQAERVRAFAYAGLPRLLLPLQILAILDLWRRHRDGRRAALLVPVAAALGATALLFMSRGSPPPVSAIGFGVGFCVLPLWVATMHVGRQVRPGAGAALAACALAALAGALGEGTARILLVRAEALPLMAQVGVDPKTLFFLRESFPTTLAEHTDAALLMMVLVVCAVVATLWIGRREFRAVSFSWALIPLLLALGVSAEAWRVHRLDAWLSELREPLPCTSGIRLAEATFSHPWNPLPVLRWQDDALVPGGFQTACAQGERAASFLPGVTGGAVALAFPADSDVERLGEVLTAAAAGGCGAVALLVRPPSLERPKVSEDFLRRHAMKSLQLAELYRPRVLWALLAQGAARPEGAWLHLHGAKVTVQMRARAPRFELPAKDLERWERLSQLGSEGGVWISAEATTVAELVDVMDDVDRGHSRLGFLAGLKAPAHDTELDAQSSHDAKLDGRRQKILRKLGDRDLLQMLNSQGGR